MIHNRHIGIPFDIINFRIIGHQVINNPEYEVLYFRIGKIQYELCPSASGDRITFRCFKDPIGMFLIEFASRIRHFRFQPDSKFDAVFLCIFHQASNAVWQFPLVHFPVA